MNKKGFISDPLVDAWAFITYFLILIIFFVIFSFGKGEVKVEIKDDYINSDYSVILRNFLRTPYKEGTVADIIARYDLTFNDDYKVIETLARNFFNEQFEHGKIGSWSIKITDMSTGKNNEFHGESSLTPGEEPIRASQIIPAYTKTYKVELIGALV